MMLSSSFSHSITSSYEHRYHQKKYLSPETQRTLLNASSQKFFAKVYNRLIKWPSQVQKFVGGGKLLFLLVFKSVH